MLSNNFLGGMLGGPGSIGGFPWRSPRLRALANGRIVTAAIQAEVTANNHYAADRFAITLALGSNTFEQAGFWAAQPDIAIEIQFSLNGGASFQSLIQGAVDTVMIDIVTGQLRLEGRDLAARLIEARTQETFANRTASEIATLLADRHGLTPVVSATTTPVGRYYENEHDRITLGQFSRATTEWDLLVFLAQQEHAEVFVVGNELHFEVDQNNAGQLSPVQTIRPSDLIDLHLERSLTLARDIEVVVKSWNSHNQSAFTQTARASRHKGSGISAAGQGGQASTPSQRYVYVRPNLTPDDALKLAQQKLAELTRHERVIEFSMPGELSVTPRSRLALLGTNTEFDQLYHVDTIDRRLNIETGFTQRIRAKNSSPRGQTTIPADNVFSVTG